MRDCAKVCQNPRQVLVSDHSVGIRLFRIFTVESRVARVEPRMWYDATKSWYRETFWPRLKEAHSKMSRHPQRPEPW